MDGGQKEDNLVNNIGKNEEKDNIVKKDGKDKKDEVSPVLVLTGSHIGCTDTDTNIPNYNSHQPTIYTDEMPCSSRALFQQQQIEMQIEEAKLRREALQKEFEASLMSDESFLSDEAFYEYYDELDRVKIDEAIFEQTQIEDVISDLNRLSDSFKERDSILPETTDGKEPTPMLTYKEWHDEFVKEESHSTSSHSKRKGKAYGRKGRSKGHRSRYEEFYSQKTKRMPNIKDKTGRLKHHSKGSSRRFNLAERKGNATIKEDEMTETKAGDMVSINDLGGNFEDLVEIPDCNLELLYDTNDARKMRGEEVEENFVDTNFIFDDSDSEDLDFAASESKITVILDAIKVSQSKLELMKEAEKTKSAFQIVGEILSEIATGIGKTNSSTDFKNFSLKNIVSADSLNSGASSEEVIRQQIFNRMDTNDEHIRNNEAKSNIKFDKTYVPLNDNEEDIINVITSGSNNQKEQETKDLEPCEGLPDLLLLEPIFERHPSSADMEADTELMDKATSAFLPLEWGLAKQLNSGNSEVTEGNSNVVSKVAGDHVIIDMDVEGLESCSSTVDYVSVATSLTFVDEKMNDATEKSISVEENDLPPGTIIDGCRVRTILVYGDKDKEENAAKVRTTTETRLIPDYSRQPGRPSPFLQPSSPKLLTLEEHKKHSTARDEDPFCIDEDSIANIHLHSLNESQISQSDRTVPPSGINRIQPRPGLFSRLWTAITSFFTGMIIFLHVNRDCLFCLGFFVAFVVCASFLTAFFYRTLNVNPHLYQRPSTGHITIASSHPNGLPGNLPTDNSYIF